MAEQEQPVRRRVAIKLIKAGLDNRQIVARFEAERQALSMMDHPSIARVLDMGSTAAGQPYFVMELVHGIPFTEYCDKNRLSLRERLELFVPVCHAIQHAHQKGIIHRDLKPSNILVAQYDGKPVPKVIDFGLAKATEIQNRLTDKTMFTEFGQVVGTIQYMSPEQAEMNSIDVDTRTDVYSLGVMLYELLTGSTPIDRETMRREAILKVLQSIREVEPPRPSARLSSASKEAVGSISEQRRIDPRKLQSLLRGELDWIVMKALEKNRNSRYLSALCFADDIERYLSGRPVTAKRYSSVSRIMNILRRSVLNHTSTWLLSGVGLFLFQFFFINVWNRVYPNVGKTLIEIRHLIYISLAFGGSLGFVIGAIKYLFDRADFQKKMVVSVITYGLVLTLPIFITLLTLERTYSSMKNWFQENMKASIDHDFGKQ